MVAKAESDLRESVEKAFRWVLDDAPLSESAWGLGRLILWLSNPMRYPNDSSLFKMDDVCEQWGIDIVNYFFISRKLPQDWFNDGKELVQRVTELYGCLKANGGRHEHTYCGK